MSRPFAYPFAALFLITLVGRAAEPWEGEVRPFRQVDLPAPVSSRVVELKVKEGETVKAGQPLAQLYVRVEELEMQRTKALLERREYEAKGAKRLFDGKVIPEARALEARTDLELARIQFETAAEQVRLRTLLAPIDGVVVEVRRELGEAVSTAQPVFRILDLSRVYVYCAVKAEALANLLPGQKVTVRCPQAQGMQTSSGEIALVDPCANATGLFRVKVLVENPDRRLRAGFKALVEPSQVP